MPQQDCHLPSESEYGSIPCWGDFQGQAIVTLLVLSTAGRDSVSKQEVMYVTSLTLAVP